jgi:hypothetical protein
MAPARRNQRRIERIESPVTLTMAGLSGHGACSALTAIKDAPRACPAVRNRPNLNPNFAGSVKTL